MGVSNAIPALLIKISIKEKSLTSETGAIIKFKPV
jgi:hypothetical protein